MATRDDIYQAIRNADAAGDSASVQKLGAYLQTMDAAPVQPEPPKGTGNAPLDATNAVSTGFNRGLVRLAGLPVDTAANVLDLGKAVLGSGYQAITGKPAPEALQLTDRKNVVGSGDYLVDRLGKTAPGNVAINPINPDYEGGYMQAAGGGLTAVINPNSRAQALNQAVLGVTSAVGGKAATDATGNPAYGVIASLAPSGVQQAVTQGTKAAVLGANPLSDAQMEAKRQQMEQRIVSLRNAGVTEPTVGLASGNPVVGGVENLLQSTPGAVGVMSRARNQAVNQLQATLEDAAAQSSGNRGALESGRAIQNGIGKFRDDFKNQQTALYNALDDYIGPQDPTSVVATKRTLAQLNADIPGAPELSKQFKNERIQSIEDAITKDTAGAPQSVQVYPRPPLPGGVRVDRQSGNLIFDKPMDQEPIQVVIPEGPPRNTLPFEAVKKLRTLVGNEMADNTIVSTVPNSKWRPLYGGLSEDIGTTAAETGPPAERAFNRANDYTRAGIDRLERVAPFAQTTAPEQAYTAMVNASKENVSTLQAVKKTLPPDARGSVAGTIIERLGKANNGVQNESGTAWSPETFLTNWNKMTPKAREEIFSGFPNSADVKANVEAVAKATSMMRDSSKMWANPSGSGANVAARMTLGAFGLGGAGSVLGLVNPYAVGGAALGLAGTNRLAAALTDQDVVNSMASRNYLSPQHFGAQVLPMFATGQLNEKRPNRMSSLLSGK